MKKAIIVFGMFFVCALAMTSCKNESAPAAEAAPAPEAAAPVADPAAATADPAAAPAPAAADTMKH